MMQTWSRRGGRETLYDRGQERALAQSETYDIYAWISLMNAVDKIVLLFRTKCMTND